MQLIFACRESHYLVLHSQKSEGAVHILTFLFLIGWLWVTVQNSLN